MLDGLLGTFDGQPFRGIIVFVLNLFVFVEGSRRCCHWSGRIFCIITTITFRLSIEVLCVFSRYFRRRGCSCSSWLSSVIYYIYAWHESPEAPRRAVFGLHQTLFGQLQEALRGNMFAQRDFIDGDIACKIIFNSRFASIIFFLCSRTQ